MTLRILNKNFDKLIGVMKIILFFLSNIKPP